MPRSWNTSEILQPEVTLLSMFDLVFMTVTSCESCCAPSARSHPHLLIFGSVLMSAISCEPGEADGGPELAPPPGKSLEMENARLRAEIATQYAMEAARSLAGEGTPRETALPLSASQRSLQGRSGQLGSEVSHCFGRSPQSHCFWQVGFSVQRPARLRGVVTVNV